ncbi:MAG: hypothetical protein FWJ70_07840 [Micromonosporaceae bacterium]|jgi:hypothetical protein
MTDPASGVPPTGDLHHGATIGRGTPVTGAPAGHGRDGQERAATVSGAATDAYVVRRPAAGDHGLARDGAASDDDGFRPDGSGVRPDDYGVRPDDYGLQPHGLARPATRSSDYDLPLDDDPTAPPALASLLRRHMPSRPSWTCVADGRPWPCAAARVHLRSQYAGDLVGLSMYMSRQLMAAAVDLAHDGAPPPDLFRRFVAWT